MHGAPGSASSRAVAPDVTMMDPEALLDSLLDLKHDLGKHLQLPLALLPKEADARAVQRAACDALLRTRRGPCGDCSARRLWTRFVEEAGDALQQMHGYTELRNAVETALSWEDKLHACGATECQASVRARISADFGRVSECIGRLIEEVTGAPPNQQAVD